MKHFGLKQLLMMSVVVLVGVSVSISSYVAYLNEESIITDQINTNSEVYVANKAQLVEVYLNEKIAGVRALGQLYQSEPFTGQSEQDYIDLTKVFAGTLNTGSSFIGFESDGRAYWNQSSEAWPNHKFNGDIRKTSYYQDGRKAIEPSVTDPYPDDANPDIYWLSIVQKTYSGVIGADMKLGFLNDIVKKTTDIPGTQAFILNHDSTVLASTSPAIPTGKKGQDLTGVGDIISQVIRAEKFHTEYISGDEKQILFSHRIQLADKTWYFVITIDKDIAFASLASAKTSAVTTALTAIVFSMLIAFLVIRFLYRPILSLKETIMGLSRGDGDLTQRLKVESHDDLGQMADGINKFIASLQQMMLDIQRVSTGLKNNVMQLKAQTEQNASILHHHASESEQIATAIEEMNVTASSMAADAVNTASLIQQANQSSDASRGILDKSQTTVSALIKDVDSASDRVQEMNKRTQGIHSILTVISEIAEQTNLLALNAAIEAARAGEQGRGFAVVADEVRNLASRTKESTGEIETALTELVKGSELVVSAMDDTRHRCQETVDGFGEVAESLDTMVNYIGDIHGLSVQIATAAEEQSSVTRELSSNMSSLHEMANELNQNGQKTQGSVAEINQMNDRLTNIVGQFKL